MKKLPTIVKLRNRSGAARLEPSETHFERTLAELDMRNADWDREHRVLGALRRLTRDSSDPSAKRALAIFGDDVVNEAVSRLHLAHVSSEEAQAGVRLDSTEPAILGNVSTTLLKRLRAQSGKFDSTKQYALIDALSIVKECASAKFDESIDAAIQLGVDAKRLHPRVQGAVVLPNGTGKTKRVAVFAYGAKAEEAKAAGADIVGMEDLAAEIRSGKMDFDVVIASPDAMRVVSPLGQVLGPRGLMPNPKVGTVTPDLAQAVRNAKAGQVQFRVDKAGIVHGTIVRRSFDADKLQGNLAALIDALNKAKPATVKGVYPHKVRARHLPGTRPGDTVSHLEMKILQLSAEGKSASQIARVLGMSRVEVDYKASAVLGKLHRGLNAA